jgi:hypothetical protein
VARKRDEVNVRSASPFNEELFKSNTHTRTHNGCLSVYYRNKVFFKYVYYLTNVFIKYVYFLYVQCRLFLRSFDCKLKR